ncbi:hypothetical protein TorRG33x02_166320 [Trema orientale]|uniref:Uncharacterized protein n=1 Tax=Trema orientale TaxID=63057 RepID=A0A2P5EQ42_TREOI|nr:hypothetical protein TorRG33x02_166320 [Trema orientale]
MTWRFVNGWLVERRMDCGVEDDGFSEKIFRRMGPVVHVDGLYWLESWYLWAYGGEEAVVDSVIFFSTRIDARGFKLLRSSTA